MSNFILNIRPDDDAARDAVTLQRYGVAALASPVMTVQKLPTHFCAPSAVSGLIFTSRHAVTIFAAAVLRSDRQTEALSWRTKPVYVVGAATARAARAAGFTNVQVGAGGGASLVPVISGRHKAKAQSLLWPSARYKSFDMVAALREHGYHVIDQPVYETVMAKTLAEDVLAAIKTGQVLAVLSLSARTSVLFINLLQSHGLEHFQSSMTFVAGSQTIADAAGSGWKEVFVAAHPRRTRLLAIATLLYRRALQDDASAGTR